jgi:hypothetical protein
MGCSGDLNNRQVDVSEDLSLNLLPSLSPFGYGLNFLFQSNSLYNCDNVGFVYTLKSSADRVNIHLLGIDYPATCNVGNAPAFEKVKVPGDEGYYSISIDIGDFIHNSGTLVVEGGVYKLHMNSSYGIALQQPVMNRIPEGTIWGYAVPLDLNLQYEVLNAVHQGLDPITDDVNMTEGYYGYYSVTKPFAIYTLFPNYHSAQTCFAFHFSMDHSILENAVAEIKAQLPPNTDFKVYTWEGAEL